MSRIGLSHIVWYGRRVDGSDNNSNENALTTAQQIHFCVSVTFSMRRSAGVRRALMHDGSVATTNCVVDTAERVLLRDAEIFHYRNRIASRTNREREGRVV